MLKISAFKYGLKISAFRIYGISLYDKLCGKTYLTCSMTYLIAFYFVNIIISLHFSDSIKSSNTKSILNVQCTLNRYYVN